jgi:hypothetical protein
MSLLALRPFALVCIATFAAPAIAQCDADWQVGKSISGANATVLCSAKWDPDGTGPADELIVFGGAFDIIGPIQANHVVAWNPTTNEWTTLGTGLDGSVWALAVLPNGNLVAGGSFLAAGGVPAQRVAMWDGNSWQAMGLGMDDIVRTLLAMPNGDVIAGGNFFNADDQFVNKVARWDGTGWNPMGSGFSLVGGSASVSSLALLPNGQPCAGGLFQGGVAAWNGTQWRRLGTGLNTNGIAYALLVRPDGSLVVAGAFTTAGGIPCNGLAIWNGTTWSAFPANPYTIGGRTLALSATGKLVLSGPSTFGPEVWDGTTWTQLGSGWSGDPVSFSTIVPLSGEQLCFGGSFDDVGGVRAKNLAIWSGSAWQRLNEDCTDGILFQVEAMPSGLLFAAGEFTRIEGTDTPNGIALNDGTGWSAVDFQLPSGGFITQCVELPNGDLAFLGGTFSSSSFGMRQSGNSWIPLPYFGGGVADAVVLPNGSIAMANSGGGVIIWDGLSSTVSYLGQSVFNRAARCIARLSNGNIVIAGDFTTLDGQPMQGVAQWSGSAWAQVGLGLAGEVRDIVAMPDGRILACGNIASAGVDLHGVGVWDGVTWQPLGGGVDGSTTYENMVESIALAPNGDVIAVGPFTSIGGVSATRIARWNGASWEPVGEGLDGRPQDVDLVGSTIVVGGEFHRAGGGLSYAVARWGRTEPPTITGQPTSVRTCVNRTSELSVTSTGTSPLSYMWRVSLSESGGPTQTTDVTDDVLASGGRLLFESTGWNTDTLTVHPRSIRTSDTIQLYCIVANACGSVDSDSAALEVCFADMTCDGGIDIADLLEFLAAFEAGSPNADLDDATGLGMPDGGVDVGDLLFFLAHFESGC